MNSILEAKRYIFDYNKGLNKYFEEAVEKYADLIALKFEAKTLTYLGLNELSNQLANFLVRKGICPGSNIGIYFNRSIELTVSVLAVLKAGCTCILLDKSIPNDRINLIMGDIPLNYVICDRDFANKFYYNGKVIICDLEMSYPYNESKTNLNIKTNTDDASFIFYTSGSTGEPKGVIISHGGIINDSLPAVAEPALNQEDCFLMTSPVGSMRITGELFYPWFAGAKVVILRESLTNDIEKNIDIINEEKVSVMFIVPTMLRELLNNRRFSKCQSLRYVQSLGERLPQYLRDKFYSKLNVGLVNVYGQTEAGCCTIYDCDYKTSHKYVKSGKQVMNRAIYILDEDLKTVASGEIGKIFIGGDYLATGYFNDPALTSERFISDPFSGHSGAVMYMTGDIGRITEDGQLEYLGRIDQIVKIGGMRLSLLEVESAILSFSEIEDVVVKAVENNRNEIFLVAVIETKAEEDVRNIEWRTQLGKKLPHYMIPSRYIYIKELPKLINGKINHKEVLKMISVDSIVVLDETNKPQTETERKLADIWSKLLVINMKNIRLSDRFLELGGNSITTVICTVEIEKEFNKQVKAAILYSYNFRELSEYIDKQTK
ncbi:MAG: non-ribosomal peptide synthetase [Lutisporaceae bacterium]